MVNPYRRLFLFLFQSYHLLGVEFVAGSGSGSGSGTGFQVESGFLAPCLHQQALVSP